MFLLVKYCCFCKKLLGCFCCFIWVNSFYFVFILFLLMLIVGIYIGIWKYVVVVISFKFFKDILFLILLVRKIVYFLRIWFCDLKKLENWWFWNLKFLKILLLICFFFVFRNWLYLFEFFIIFVMIFFIIML